MIENYGSDNIVVGLRQSLKMLEANKVKKAYMAEDIDFSIAVRFSDECEKHGVEIERVETKAALGKACHIDVDASVVSILK